MKPIHTALLLLLLLAACTAGDRQQRLAQLAELEQRNIDDSLMTDDALAEQLADYFDRHGTPNEQLRAHYILGRTYADLGEAPAALNAYQDAADCADTTAQDCDWAKLSRVYGQMSDVFSKQNLMDDYLKANRLSVCCAWRAKDTLQALRESAYRIVAFDRLMWTDSVITAFDDVYNKLLSLYGIKVAAQYCALPINSLLEKKELQKAQYYLDVYKHHSGFFDADGHVQRGREAYYYYRGKVHLSLHHNDSAEYYFRQEFLNGSDFTNLCMASHGLSLIYQQTHRYDSAAKYAIYSYAMNDSVYAHKATSDVEKMAALYNYHRHQKQAIQEHEYAVKQQKKAGRLYVLLFLSASIFFFFLVLWHRKRKAAIDNYSKKLLELSQARQQLETLRSQLSVNQLLEESLNKSGYELAVLKAQNDKLVIRTTELEEMVQSLQTEIDNQGKDLMLARKVEERILAESDLYNHLLQSFAPLSEEKWVEVETLVKEVLPGYYQFILPKKNFLGSNEYKLCLLLRLHLGLKETARLLGLSQSVISKTSAKLLAREFNQQGSGKELRKLLETIA